MLYKHVLFKDLKDYIRKDQYFEDYTETEKAWVKQNLDIVGKGEIQLLIDSRVAGVKEVTYNQLQTMLKETTIQAGFIYIIQDFESMWIEKGTIKKSDPFKLLIMAYSPKEFLPNAIALNNLNWEIKYDITPKEISPGIFNKGTITYLEDENFNKALFDFKHIKCSKGYLFQDLEGNENSTNCKNNDLTEATNIYLTGNCNYNIIRGNNIQFKVPISGLIGELNNVCVDKLDFNDETLKQAIKLNNKYYIDYLDYETLTHQFYAIDTIQ